jgi:hypothetical protein
MNSLRKIVGFLVVLMLAAFALPASADDDAKKNFTLKVVGGTATATEGSSLAAGSSQVLTATFTNALTSSSSASFNSITLSVGAGLTISPNVAATPITASYVGFTGTPPPPSAVSANSVTFTGLSPVKRGKGIVVTLTVSAASACTSPPPEIWSGTAWTGSPTSGSSFLMTTPATSPDRKTAITGLSCTMAFVNTPQDIVSGGLLGSVANPVSVQGSPAVAFSGKSITLGSVAALSPVGANIATADVSGLAIFPGLRATGVDGPYSLSATTGLTGYPTTSAPFNIAPATAILDCEGQPNGLPNGFNGSSGGTAVVGSRGGNKDNSICKLTKFDLAFRTDGSVGFTWNTTLQPNGAFTYEIQWIPEHTVDGLPVRTQVAWTVDINNDPIYVTGRFCLSPDLPKQYGTLTYAINSTESPITITSTGPAILPTVAFPLVIGTERMSATPMGGGVYTVARGAGGTLPAGHLALAAVMSTPFPLDGAAAQMRMCLADETVQVVQPSACTSSVDPNTTCVAVTTQIDDAGDGFTIRK